MKNNAYLYTVEDQPRNIGCFTLYTGPDGRMESAPGYLTKLWLIVIASTDPMPG